MSKTLSYRVNGTTCASCEIVLERELKTLPGVQKVRASHNDGTLELEVNEGVSYRPADLEVVVGKHGYSFSTVNGSGRSDQAGRQQATLTAFSWGRVGGAAVLVLALYLVMKQTGLLTFSPAVEGGTSLAAVFAIGLVAAVSSCTAVVGGLIVAVSASAAKRRSNASNVERIRPHLLFNTGRLLGFVGFGALIGWLGQALTLTSTMNGVLVVLIAILMIALGVNLLDVLPKDVVSLRPPKWMSHRIVSLTESNHPFIPFVLGALTFFLPCGFTQSMQLYALSTGDPVQAAATMGVFALGTLPAMLGIGIATSVAKGATLKYVTRAAGAMVIVLGISNVGNGANLLGLSFPSTASNISTTSTTATIVDGAQHIQMEVSSYGGYAPDTFRVVAGTPVTWEIYGGKNMGCGSTLVASAFGIQKNLQPGFNKIAFTPTKPGTYTFTCSMGMFRGTMIVEPSS